MTRTTRAATRAFDVVVASLGLLLAAVPCALAAALVKSTSPGPAFFRQVRIGRGGRPFVMWKLRTMHAGSAGPAVTAGGDARITPVGRVLRRWKIDELPQLWNVLRGDMGIVGPRPEVERFVARYTPAERRVLDVRPGLAGMAQVRFPGEAEALAEAADPERAYVEDWMPAKIAADLAYEVQRTFRSDLRLLGQIALLVLGRGGAADAPPFVRRRACASEAAPWPSTDSGTSPSRIPGGSPSSRRTTSG